MAGRDEGGRLRSTATAAGLSGRRRLSEGRDRKGNGRERGDGTVPPGLEHKAYLAQANCPELAIEVIEEQRS